MPHLVDYQIYNLRLSLGKDHVPQKQTSISQFGIWFVFAMRNCVPEVQDVINDASYALQCILMFVYGWVILNKAGERYTGATCTSIFLTNWQLW